jgi:hypothetical protein
VHLRLHRSPLFNFTADRGPLSEGVVGRLFRTILEESRALQRDQMDTPKPLCLAKILWGLLADVAPQRTKKGNPAGTVPALGFSAGQMHKIPTDFLLIIPILDEN